MRRSPSEGSAALFAVDLSAEALAVVFLAALAAFLAGSVRWAAEFLPGAAGLLVS
ncbi:hypothetical protein AB0I54_43810 [Streptomyces sp. NPDC050625]|uniref:hypothetical protein n=1 Tax=Streptomyces sp. NPDC050625 TaxID=3154629 RepID=UPI003447C8D8